jgi:hypothetical protein
MKLACQISQQTHFPHQEKVILYQVILEALSRQRAISKSSNKLVFGVFLPGLLNIGSFKNILNEPTPAGR